jgi:predicted small metal-binding protein
LESSGQLENTDTSTFTEGLCDFEDTTTRQPVRNDELAKMFKEHAKHDHGMDVSEEQAKEKVQVGMKEGNKEV